MEYKECKVYNSSEGTDYLELQAPYYNAINPTKVKFQQEQISAYVDSLGHVEFYDMDENSLGFVDVPVDEDPSKYAHSAQYGTVKCMADGDKITFQLPVYDWDDYYPNCDGESDRWNRRTIRWFNIEFDCKTQQIMILNK